MTVKTVKSPYIPRWYFEPLHSRSKRFTTIVAHRRAGKSLFCINEIIFKALQCKLQRPQYAYIAPEKTQAKKIMWNYLKDYTRFIPGVKIYESELKAVFPTLHGSEATVYLDGADNPDRLRGMYFDGVVLDEVAQMPRSIWQEVVSPSLMDRSGWAIFIGTPKGKNIFKDLYDLGLQGNENWESHLFKASTTKIIKADDLKTQKEIQGEELYNQEYECSWDSTFSGSFFGKTLQQLKVAGNIRTIGHNRDYKVITSWDLGYQDKTAIWFAQQIGDQVFIIDYYENSKQPITHYINYVMSKPYVYAHHIIPHDAYQNHLNSEFSSAEQMRRAGMLVFKARKGQVIEGINTSRQFLTICHFDAYKCREGLNALGDYKAREDPTVGVEDQPPLHDINSHAADAFRYLATTMRVHKDGSVYAVRTQVKEVDLQFENYDPFDF